MTFLRTPVLFAVASLALGCGASVTPGVPAEDTGVQPDAQTPPDTLTPVFDAGAPDVPRPTDLGPPLDVRPAVDAPFTCALPGGGTCTEGQSCRHPDGCNTCTCRERNPMAACTTLGCLSDGGPALSCRGHADCRGGEECRFPAPGCGLLGTCGTITDCASVQEYCGCDGASFRDCPSAPTRAWVATGPCLADAGVPTDMPLSPDAGVCAGAFISRAYACMGPSGAMLPNGCCVDWPCDTRGAICARIPPVCPSGQVPIAQSGCYGACVPATNCAPMSCREGACPSGWACDATSGTCRFLG